VWGGTWRRGGCRSGEPLWQRGVDTYGGLQPRRGTAGDRRDRTPREGCGEGASGGAMAGPRRCARGRAWRFRRAFRPGRATGGGRELGGGPHGARILGLRRGRGRAVAAAWAHGGAGAGRGSLSRDREGRVVTVSRGTTRRGLWGTRASFFFWAAGRRRNLRHDERGQGGPLQPDGRGRLDRWGKNDQRRSAVGRRGRGKPMAPPMALGQGAWRREGSFRADGSRVG